MNEKIKNRLVALEKYDIKPLKIKEFDDALIVYLTKEDFLRIWKEGVKKAKELQEKGFSLTKALSKVYYYDFKILNRSSSPVKLLNVGYSLMYSLVRDREKVFEYLERDFYKWANGKRKMAKKEAKELGLNEKETRSFLNKIETMIAEQERLKDEIKANPDDYDVIFTNYFHVKELYRPFAYLNELKTGKKYKTNLRVEVPNLIYEEDFLIKKKPHPKKLEDELRGFSNPYGFIYVKKRKN